ncbi:MAG: hypothetical protein U9Q06_01640 [Nanoarchaeota archaeon]|nr:hypothetical protein [Nanoarchaeota archaeon]
MKVKQGQIKLSFSMIFSIFLMMVFLFVAFYAINMFVGVTNKIDPSMFINNLKDEINNAWRSSGSEEVIELNLKNQKVTHICFFNWDADFNGPYDEQYEEIENSGDGGTFYFYPRRGVEPNSAKINHINLNEFDSNPYCIEKQDGKFSIRIDKRRNEALVRVSQG